MKKTKSIKKDKSRGSVTAPVFNSSTIDNMYPLDFKINLLNFLIVIEMHSVIFFYAAV